MKSLALSDSKIKRRLYSFVALKIRKYFNELNIEIVTKAVNKNLIHQLFKNKFYCNLLLHCICIRYG